MKIKTKIADYEAVMSLPRARHKPPRRPGILFRSLVRLLATKDLRETDFTYTIDGAAAEALRSPCLILMNHSSFIDLEIVSKILYPMPYGIVCTSDGFVGKEWLMRQIGCIPTQKFVPDATLIGDIQYALAKKRCHVLMYPEASYSFDGCATALPDHLGSLFRRLHCPVVMIRTTGAFARDPLYNGLQKRRVKVSAAVSLLVSRQECDTLPPAAVQERLTRAFDFDNFAEQSEKAIAIREDFRADGLERILYKCAACGAEDGMTGKGVSLVCARCGKKYTMTPLGKMEAEDGQTEFAHIPDWYRWERACVKREIDAGEYRIDTEVSIGVMVNYDAIYMVGDGRLTHTEEGFTLTGCGGRILYRQKPQSSYGLYADYFWYEIGDMICIGNRDCLYYCFPKGKCPVAKARMAAEELYRRAKQRLRAPSEPSVSQSHG